MASEQGRRAPCRSAGRPDIRATALVPSFHASTNAVRQVLPSDVSHIDARFNDRPMQRIDEDVETPLDVAEPLLSERAAT